MPQDSVWLIAYWHGNPPQIALAWLLAQRPWIVPIPVTQKVEHLDENLAATNIQLTRGDLDEIESAASSIRGHGTRDRNGMSDLTAGQPRKVLIVATRGQIARVVNNLESGDDDGP